MSVVIETLICCDGEGPTCYGNDWSADSRHLSTKEQRRMAREQLGWHHSGGEDFCASCWEHRKLMRKERS